MSLRDAKSFKALLKMGDKFYCSGTSGANNTIVRIRYKSNSSPLEANGGTYKGLGMNSLGQGELSLRKCQRILTLRIKSSHRSSNV